MHAGEPTAGIDGGSIQQQKTADNGRRQQTVGSGRRQRQCRVMSGGAGTGVSGRWTTEPG